MRVNKYFLLLLSLSLYMLSSCAGSPSVSVDSVLLLPPANAPQWLESGIPGVRLLSGMDSGSYVGGAVLALDTGALEYRITGPDPQGKGDTLSSRTSEFAAKENIHVALNASPFTPMDKLNRSGRAMDIVGIQIYHGQVQSGAVPRYDALYILSDGEIQFGSQRDVPEDTRHALGGFFLLLKEGENLGVHGRRDPRTAIGINRDGSILYLAVFDGRQKNRVGLTTEETARWMKWIGCHWALNMDGGGSSSLALKKNGTVQLLNSPVHRGKPGLERAVANHLGILVRSENPYPLSP